jgi:DNA polymerase-3 subunit epsilon
VSARVPNVAPVTAGLDLHAAGSARRWAEQQSFEELGRPLRDVTFCVVDLETTGGSPLAGSQITEVGAVKVRAGAVIGEFQTLVNPQQEIPPFIALLTGISNAMVAGAPRIDVVLPEFLAFARDTVLVAHNAPFDIGFLRHAANLQERPWPRLDVVDTAVLARRILPRSEVRNHKLATLAEHFHASATPNHRALADARATVDVLHGLIGRLGNLGVHTLEELQTYTSRVTSAQRRKRHLAEHLPHAPGVYLFRDAHERVLYVGTSKDLRKRVRSYFTASETRSRMGQMVALAHRVEGIVCSTPLEANIRELRLIAEHKPRFNRRSRHPDRVHWVRLTSESWPRLSIVRHVSDDSAVIGPFSSKQAAERAVAAVQHAFPLRQCSSRMPRLPVLSPCALAELGRCLSPCDQSVTHDDYQAIVSAVRDTFVASPDPIVQVHLTRIQQLAIAERFEDAALVRDRLQAFVNGAARAQRLSSLTRCEEIVAARKEEGRWSVQVVRRGRLVASGVIPPGADAAAWVLDLRRDAETVVPSGGPAPAASVEESERVLAWLESDGVRLVHTDGAWTCPLASAVKVRETGQPAVLTG